MIVRENDRVRVIVRENYVEKIFKKSTRGSLNEINILSTLNHPNIINRLDITTNEHNFITVKLERMTTTLIDWLVNPMTGKQNNISTEEKISVIFQIINGVEYLHNNDILHLDLKPDNIMISYIDNKPIVKIIDFDNSRYMTSNVIYSDITIGTITHRAPECDSHDISILTTASDVWSVGVLIYEILDGCPIYMKSDLPNCSSLSLDDYEIIICKYLRSEKHQYSLRQILPPEMLRCFEIDPNHRLSLDDLVEIFEETYDVKNIKQNIPDKNNRTNTTENIDTLCCKYYYNKIQKIKSDYGINFSFYPTDIIEKTSRSLNKLCLVEKNVSDTYFDLLIYIIHRMIPNAQFLDIDKYIKLSDDDMKLSPKIIMKLDGMIYL